MLAARFLVSSITAIVSYHFFLSNSPFEGGKSSVEFDKEIGFWHKPNFSTVTHRECYKTPFFYDEKGLIKNTYQLDNDKNDIVIFGDSYIEAIMVNNENILHNGLYESLKQEFNVLNYALSSTAPTQHLKIYETKVDKEKALMVLHFINMPSDLFDVLPNDRSTSQRPLAQLNFNTLSDYEYLPVKEYDTIEKLRDFLGSTEYYFYAIKSWHKFSSWLYSSNTPETNITATIKSDEPEYSSNLEEALTKKSWIHLIGSINELQQRTAEDKVIYLPAVFSEAQPHPSSFILKSYFDQKGIDYIDIDNLLSAIPQENRSFTCDNHWNNETHQFLGQALGAPIQSKIFSSRDIVGARLLRTSN